VEQARQASRARRHARYESVVTLSRRGMSLSAIAQQLGIDRKTAGRFAHAVTFPERRAAAKRPTLLDPYKDYLLSRWNEGCHNGVQLWREIQTQGYAGSRSLVARYVARLRRSTGVHVRNHTMPHTCPATDPDWRPPTSRQLIWLCLHRPDELSDTQRNIIAQIGNVHPEVQTGVSLAQDFVRMVRGREAQALDTWLTRTVQSEIAELRSFAMGLRRDQAAVRAALSLAWSNGPTEGHINRLKLIKRQMYGRAKFDLLRSRVLYAA
jgi:transposase